jgi:phosphoglycerate dehydrogenase-like enzyme
MKNGKYQIAVTIQPEQRHINKLLELSPEADIAFMANSELESRIGEYDIIFGNPPAAWMKRAVSLKLHQLNSAGADAYPREVYANDVVLANASGAYGFAISEVMLGMQLTLIKNLHIYRDNQNQRLWQSAGKVTSVYGSTVLCLGVGDIGSCYARRVAALGARVIGIRRTAAALPDFLDEVYTQDELPKVVGRADMVALSLPNTDKTRHILSREIMGMMKPGACVINVGRGSAIDTEALCDMLESGRLGGAALDVTDPEPLPPEHRLWGIKNAFITPHSSGGYNLAATLDMIVDIVMENIERFMRGEKLARVVSFEERY